MLFYDFMKLLLLHLLVTVDYLCSDMTLTDLKFKND